MADLIISNPITGFKAMRGNRVEVRGVVRDVTDPLGLVKSSMQPWAYIYTCMLNVDWDGAPDAYGLDRPGFADQTGLTPREPGKKLAFARVGADWSKKWAAIINVKRADAIDILRSYSLIPAAPAKGTPDVLSPASEAILARFWDNRTSTQLGHSLENLATDGQFPIVQIKELPTTKKTGYYVSTTGWMNKTKKRWDPHAYLDASAVAYTVQPALAGVRMGDYGLVVRNATGASIALVCGDSSGQEHGSTKLGECSGAVFTAMGNENEGDFSFILFPGSRTGVSLEDSSAAANAVRTQLNKLSADEADTLANALAPRNAMGRFHVRTALTKWGAPQMVPPAVDAISGAGRRAP